jgi:hypothetical protein
MLGWRRLVPGPMDLTIIAREISELLEAEIYTYIYGLETP